MPIRRIHVKIDENILKPYKLIPTEMNTKSIHGAIDEGKTGGKLHRVLDKWHNSRYVGYLGLNTKLKKEIKRMGEYKERNFNYRVTMMHVIVDELYTRYTYEHKCEPTYKELETMVKRRVCQKTWVRRHFNL